MSEQDSAAPAATVTPTPVVTPMSQDDAVSALRKMREAPEVTEPATPVEAGAADTESEAPQGEADTEAGDTQPPGETEEADAAGEPPVEPPRTLTKAEKEAFSALPRDVQELWANRERDRDAYYNRGLQEAAEKSRAAEARESAAEQARQHYEQTVPALLEQYQAQFQDKFGNLTWADVETMRQNDPMSWMEWRDAKDRGVALQNEAQRIAYEKQEKEKQDWKAFSTAEDAAFFEKAPDLKDSVKIAKAQADAVALLTDLGFTPAELREFSTGKKISPLDHRFQLLVRDGVRWRNAQKALKAAQPKPVPPVQRPGTASQKGEAGSARIQDAQNKLNRTGKVDDAVALLRARRRA